MPWYFPWSDSIKKRAVRYLLQHYMGHLLKEKLSLDQLSVDLYDGKGTAKDILLDVAYLNEALDNASVPLEIIDGYIGSISVSVPWSALVTDSTIIEINNLEITMAPKQRTDNGGVLLDSMLFSSMTTSMQLAEECLRQEPTEGELKAVDTAQPFEGLELFAKTIEAVLSKIKVSFNNTTVRLEHVPADRETGNALEVHIQRIDFFDDLASEQDADLHKNTAVDISIKNLHMLGVKVYCDEFRAELRTIPRDLLASEKSLLYEPNSLDSLSPTDTCPVVNQTSGETADTKSDATASKLSELILIAELQGRQELKLRIKQNDALPGAKLELDCSIGCVHFHFTPHSMHLILDIVNGLSSSSEGVGSKRSANKHLNQTVFEQELHRHLEQQCKRDFKSSKRKDSESSEGMFTQSLDESDDEIYLSLAHNGSSANSMESSACSSASTITGQSVAFSKKQVSSHPSQISSSSQSQSSKKSKDSKTQHRARLQSVDDQSNGDVTKIRLKIAFMSLVILHDDQQTSVSSDGIDPLSSSVSLSGRLHNVAEKYFDNVRRDVTIAGVTTASGMTQLRNNYSKACPVNHIGLLCKPVTLELSSIAGRSTQVTNVDLSIGLLDVVEAVFEKRPATSSIYGFHLPIENVLPEYTELLVFIDDKANYNTNKTTTQSSMYTSLWSAPPSFKLHAKSTTSQNVIPKTDIEVELTSCRCELDITITDRIHSLLNRKQPLTTKTNAKSVYWSLQHATLTQSRQTLFTQAIDEDSSGSERKFDVQVACSAINLIVRFPKVDLRTGADKPWWKRNLHSELLILDLENTKLKSSVDNSLMGTQIEFTCRQCRGSFSRKVGDNPVDFLHIRAGSPTLVEQDAGFDWPREDSSILRFFDQLWAQSPLLLVCQQCHGQLAMFMNSITEGVDRRLVVKSYPQKQSMFDGVIEESAVHGDSLNGACQFSKTGPSPFSSRKVMYENEELIMPGDKQDTLEFQEKAVDNTQLHLDITFPNLNIYLPNKEFLEIVYNRLLNDLLLWEPLAPVPLDTQDLHSFMPLTGVAGWSPELVPQLMRRGLVPDSFSAFKSATQFESSSDSDEDVNDFYSISSEAKRRQRLRNQWDLSPRQSRLCVTVGIGKGLLYGRTEVAKTDAGKSAHGEFLLEIEDSSILVVVGYNGDVDLQFLCVQLHKAQLDHLGFVESSQSSVTCLESLLKGAASCRQRSLRRTIYLSDNGINSRLRGKVGRGADTEDMVTVAVRISNDTLSSVKKYQIAFGVRGSTLRHRTVESNLSWFNQNLRFSLFPENIVSEISPAAIINTACVLMESKPTNLTCIKNIMDFFSLVDYEIPGYSLPKVVMELHTHLWSCSVDYRPTNLKYRALLTMETFSVSSNIIIDSTVSLLRFLVDEGAFYLSDNVTAKEVDVKKNYVCVLDVGLFEIALRTSDGTDQRHAKMDVRASNNIVHLWTCSDSCFALTELINYLSKDGDLSGQSLQSADKTASVTPSSDCCSVSDSPKLARRHREQVHDMVADAMKEASIDEEPAAASSHTMASSQSSEALWSSSHSNDTRSVNQASALMTSALEESSETENLSDYEEFCVIDEPGLGISPKNGEPLIRVLTSEPIHVVDDHFRMPVGKADMLKAPDNFPMPVYRYTISELSILWSMYGGHDFKSSAASAKKPSEAHNTKTATPSSSSSAGRDTNTLMELHLNKIRLQHELYPDHTTQASRQVLIIGEIEIRDRLALSKINKFLYQYSSDAIPRQSHASMLSIKALHIRPDSNLVAQECMLKVSLQPLRLNVDQDALFFFRSFFTDISDRFTSASDVKHSATEPNIAHLSTGDPVTLLNSPKHITSDSTQPVMSVGGEIMANMHSLPNHVADPEEMLLIFSEIAEAASARHTSEADAPDNDSSQASATEAPIFFKIFLSGSIFHMPVCYKFKVLTASTLSFVFSPDVPIRLDYHGKWVDMEQGTLAGLIVGLAQLNCSELRLKRLSYRHGLLGFERVVAYALSEWLQDIKKNQQLSLLGGVGPMYSLVQLVHGCWDLFRLPVEQYRRDGRIVRGIQRGAHSFMTCTAMSTLELTNRFVQTIQFAAEAAYDVVSPGPSVRTKRRSSRRSRRCVQPADLRQGVANAVTIVTSGLRNTADNIYKVAIQEHEHKGLTGAVGGVLRQIPSTVLEPVIIATEATSNVLGGMRNQLLPDKRVEDEHKWKPQTDSD